MKDLGVLSTTADFAHLSQFFLSLSKTEAFSLINYHFSNGFWFWCNGCLLNWTDYVRGEFTKPKSSATTKFENVLCFCLCYECLYVVLEML